MRFPFSVIDVIQYAVAIKSKICYKSRHMSNIFLHHVSHEMRFCLCILVIINFNQSVKGEYSASALPATQLNIKIDSVSCLRCLKDTKDPQSGSLSC